MELIRRVVVAVLLAVAIFASAALATYWHFESRTETGDPEAGAYDLPEGYRSYVVYDRASNAEYLVVEDGDGDIAMCPRIGGDGRPAIMPRG